MAVEGRAVLAVVPARGGSKGLPGKNLRHLGGQSLVARAAVAARALDEIDAAVLSTDDAGIAAEGRRHGLDVPFLRPAELSDDSARSVDAWRHAWLESEAHFARRFDVSVLLEPTSPLRTPGDISGTLAALLDGGYDAAATVSPTPAHFAPQKTLTVGSDGHIRFFDENNWTARRQDAPQYVHRNGLCYAALRETVVDRGMIVERNCVAVVIERPVVNIDDPFDLEFAEFLMARQADQR